MRLFIGLSIIFILAQAQAQQNFDTVKILPVKIKENIFMLKGRGGNIGVITGKDGILMIDDQYAPLSEKIKASIKTLDPGQLRFIINTHVHGDHSGSNENFAKEGITILAHENVRTRMMTEQVNKTLNRTTPPRPVEAWPVITFDDKIRFHINGEDVEVTHFNFASHTDGDAIIRFVNANVMHTGDTFIRYGYPFIDISSGGSFTGFIAVLDKILEMANDQTVIIPGHGELAAKKDVQVFRDRLVQIRDKVTAALKKGKKPEEIPGLGITDPFDAEWGKGFIKGKDFVMLIVEELKGQKK